MLATLVDDPFSDPEWIFETKWDGFRSVCFVRNGKPRFVSRNQIDMTPQYPELAAVAAQIDAREAILDGEIVALDKDGMPRFQLLQPRVGRKSGIEALRGSGHIVYFVFDLLYVDGYDLMSCPVVERKRVLEQVLKPANFIKLSEHVVGRTGDRLSYRTVRTLYPAAGDGDGMGGRDVPQQRLASKPRRRSARASASAGRDRIPGPARVGLCP